MYFHFLFKANNQKDKICNYSNNMKEVLKWMNDLSLDMHSSEKILYSSQKPKNRKEEKILMAWPLPQRLF